MDWIHCNTCFKQPRSQNPNFVLSSCGHIFCKDCENRDKAEHCLSCNTPCMFMTLSSSMKPEVKTYFEDLESKLKSVYECFRFQKSHRLNLYKKHARVVEELRIMKLENQSLKKKLKKLDRKLEIYERRSMETAHRSANNEFINFTPSGINRTLIETPPTSGKRSASQGSGNINHQNSFQFTMPNLKSYQQYRSVAYPTPEESVSGTPERFVRQFNDRMNFAPYPHVTQNQHGHRTTKTPTTPFDGLNRLHINDRRNRQ